MVIVGFIGEMRSGKTLMMTYYLADYLRRNPKNKIFTNYGVSYKHTLVTPKSMSDAAVDPDNDIFKDCGIGIDEMHIFMDSRTSGAKRNRLLSYFLTQSGKNQNMLCYTSQFLRQVDVRLRMNTSILYKTYRVRYNPLTQRFSKIRQDDPTTNFQIKLERYEMQDTRQGLMFVPVWKKIIWGPQKLFGLYNTKERIFLPDEEDEKKDKRKKKTED